MFKKTIFVGLLLLVSTIVYAADHKEMSTCLPDNLGNYKPSSDILVSVLKDDVLSVLREYQHEDKKVNVSVWKIPGDKEIWPLIGGQAKATMVVVSGRLCILNVDETSNTTTLVVNIDKGYLYPPPFLYRVSIHTNNKDGSDLVQNVAGKLDYDKLFSLYDSD
jgi:hypothetical protein